MKRLLVLFAVLAVSISCGKNTIKQGTFKINVPRFQCSPGETLLFSIDSENIFFEDSITWYVNNVKQISAGPIFELTTDSAEKRYSVFAKYTDGTIPFFSDTLICYGTNNPDLLKVVYKYIDKYNYNAAISVSIYGGDVKYDFASGMSSLSLGGNNTIDSQHLLFSITKSFVAAVILNLAKEDKLALNNKVYDYLPELNPIYINGDATIEELLTHRSGISDYTDNPDLILNNPFYGVSKWEPLLLLNYIQTPANPRGDFIYSSSNYILLGRIAEIVSGTSLNTLIKRFFEEQIGSIELRLSPQDVVDYDSLTHPHVYPNTFLNLDGDGVTLIDLSEVVTGICELQAKCSWAAGGMVGSAKETAIWGYNLLSFNGSVIQFVRESIMNSVHAFVESDPPSSAYGMAIRKLFYKSKEFVGSYGRSVGDENLMFYNADKDVCIVILTSSNTRDDGTPNIDELMFSIYDVL